MTRKIITGVIAAILVVTIAVFAAEKAKEKAFAEKPCPKAKVGEQPALSKVEGEQHEGLLDQLAEAYKANDRDKMGEIINQMQERRENQGKFAKLNKWHKWAHRRMMGQMGQGQQMAGPGQNRGCAMRGPGPNQGCLPYRDGQATMAMAGPQCGQFQQMRGHSFAGSNNMMGNCCPMAGGFRQMPCRQDGMGMGPQQNSPGQMRGFGRGGFQQDCAPGSDGGNMEPQGCNMPHREKQNNVPPAEWGW